MAKKKLTTLSGEKRPGRVTEVNAFLRENGVEGVELRRRGYYFDFFGPATYGWMMGVVPTAELGSMTLGEWLGKYRELERQNRSDPLGLKSVRGKSRFGGGGGGGGSKGRGGSKRRGRGGKGG
jgi:hypothetical protein